MSVNVETLEKLERRITLTLPADSINDEVQSRLRKLSRTVKAAGFRPGKVPMSVVAQRYGYSVHYEVMNDKVGRAFSDAATEAKLRVAGAPTIKPKEEAPEGQLAFGRAFLLRDLRLACDAQLGFVGGLREGFAHLVVHHFVVHRVAVALGHDVHRHLARTKSIHLDGARQALQSRVDFRLDDFDGQRQRDLAFELFQGFNIHGHVGLSSLNQFRTELKVCLAMSNTFWCAGGDSNPHAIAGVRT